MVLDVEEAVEERGEEESTQSLGRITVANLWCDGICVPTLRLFDAIEGGSDLSTSHNQDTAGIGCESTWTWFYGTTMIFLYGEYADSYESAICGFWVREITLNLCAI